MLVSVIREPDRYHGLESHSRTVKLLPGQKAPGFLLTLWATPPHPSPPSILIA